MPTLGVVMIVKNEARCLVACLRSVVSIADEFVIGDTGSTDETVEIAKRYAANVFPVDWHEDFAEARNRVLDAATANWLLHLDADEVVDPENASRIRTLVDADGEGADAIEVTLANYSNRPQACNWVPAPPDDPMARGYSGYIPVKRPRLFRRGKGFHYQGPLKEDITESVLKAGGVIRAEPVLIHHYGYEASQSERGRLFLRIALQKVEQSPNNAEAWHEFAELLLEFNQAELAEEAARRALALEPRHLGASTTLGNILLNRGDVREAHGLFAELEAAGTSPPEVVTALGAIAIRQDRLDEARTRLAKVIEAAPNAIVARLYYARALDLSGRADEAHAHLEETLALAPALSEIQDRLEAHRLRQAGAENRAMGKLQKALGMLVKALKRDAEDPLIYHELGLVMLALGQTAAAEKSFVRAELLAPSLTGRRKPL